MCQSVFKQKGITLIELLIALAIFGTVIAGIYRLFVAQGKAYVVQDQVVEVQQGVRSVMEILLRDLRMTGFDDDSLNSRITISTPLIPGDHSITVSYEYDTTTQHTITYSRDDVTSKLTRQLTTIRDDGSTIVSPPETLLDNVDAFDLTYGVDTNGDGALDNWVSSGGIGTAKVVAVRVNLTARPDQTNQDVKNLVSPRTLNSMVTLRNLCFGR